MKFIIIAGLAIALSTGLALAKAGAPSSQWQYCATHQC
jgi:hypothetical protein